LLWCTAFPGGIKMQKMPDTKEEKKERSKFARLAEKTSGRHAYTNKKFQVCNIIHDKLFTKMQ
jgi:hypothetical protein